MSESSKGAERLIHSMAYLPSKHHYDAQKQLYLGEKISDATETDYCC